MTLTTAKFRYEQMKKRIPDTSKPTLQTLLVDFKDKKLALEKEIPLIQSVIDCIEKQLTVGVYPVEETKDGK